MGLAFLVIALIILAIPKLRALDQRRVERLVAQGICPQCHNSGNDITGLGQTAPYCGAFANRPGCGRVATEA